MSAAAAAAADPMRVLFEELVDDKEGGCHSGTIGQAGLRQALSRVLGRRGLSDQDVAFMLKHSRGASAARGGGLEDIDFGRFAAILEEVNLDAIVAKSCVMDWLKQAQVYDVLAEGFVEHLLGKGSGAKGGGLAVTREMTEHVAGQVLEDFKGRARELIAARVRARCAAVDELDARTANEKFALTAGAFVGNYAQIELFFKGLDGYIGLPSHKVYHQMEAEHCLMADSHDTFVTSNYGGTQTHPRLEWEFVVCPVAGKAYPGLLYLCMYI